jgi:hypothetical protein
MSTTKTIAIVLGVAAVGVGGVYLYRRGKAQQEVVATQPASLKDTLQSGLSSVVAGLFASTPTSGSPATTRATTPTEASDDPRRTQTAPRHSRRQPVFYKATETWRDRYAQGLTRSN